MKDTTPFIAKVSKSITDINQKHWDSIFPSIPESYNFFKTIDETLLHQFKPYYISIYEGSQIVCVAPCFIMDYPLDTTVEGSLKRIMSKIRNILPKLFTLRLLVCGCPAAEGRMGVKDFSCRDIIKALINAMDLIAKKENAHLIAFKDFTEEYAALFKQLLKIRFHKIQSYPSVELDLHFKSFEEYQASLSRITRKDLKRKFKKLNDNIKIEMEVTGELGELLDEAYELYLNTLNKSEVQFEILTKDFFKNISKNMPEETKYFLWWLNGELVAFDLCLVSNGVLVDEYIGMDYNIAYKYHLYYVTFRDIIIWCLKNGVHRYESGALGYDPKKRLDFKFIPLYIYVKHTNTIMNLLFGLVCMLLKPENFDPLLKSLKNMQNEKG